MSNLWGTRTFGAKRVWKVSTCSPTSVSLEWHPLTIQLDHSALRSSPHGPGDHKEPLTLRRSPRRYLQTWRTYVKNHQAFGPTNHEHVHTNYWSLDDNLTLIFMEPARMAWDLHNQVPIESNPWHLTRHVSSAHCRTRVLWQDFAIKIHQITICHI